MRSIKYDEVSCFGQILTSNLLGRLAGEDLGFGEPVSSDGGDSVRLERLALVKRNAKRITAVRTTRINSKLYTEPESLATGAGSAAGSPVVAAVVSCDSVVETRGNWAAAVV